MPPTGKRRVRNKDAAEPRLDADVPEANTPSRKRRRVNGTEKTNTTSTATRPARRMSAETDATIENVDGDENDMDMPQEYREAERITQRLRVAAYEVGAAVDYNNTIIPQNAQAFAKIAGRHWTYYVTALTVVIGRPNNKMKRESGEGGVVVPATSDLQINIDLGPDQQISRVHAEISYESEEQEWVIQVNGRNGLTIDDVRLERGQSKVLRSGAVITVMGTQMIFLLPNKTPIIHESIRRMLLVEGEDDDDPTLPEDKSSHGTNRRLGGRPGNTNGGGNALPRGSGVQGGSQAAHALATLASSQNPPGTPVPRAQAPLPKAKNSPAYIRGTVLENNDEIDYSVDAAKDTKPPHSYAQMIGQAILSRGEENATLAQIYEFIKERYAYFRHGGGGWQNSIRHNLSLSKHFEKIPRRTDEPGKGMKWQIVPDYSDEYMKKNFHDNRKLQRRPGSSGPNSPAVNMGPGAQTERLMHAMHAGDATTTRVKDSSRSPTPQPHAYPAPNESYTPDRGPHSIRLQTSHLPGANGTGPVSATSEIMTPTFDRSHPPQQYSAGSRHGEGLNDRGAGSPPTMAGNLTAGGYDVGSSNVFTPLPARHAPKHVMASTVKPPSFYAKELFSSPAPFWRYAEGAFPGSTPLKPMPDLSPEKMLAQAQAARSVPAFEEDVKTDEVGTERDDVDEDKMEEDPKTDEIEAEVEAENDIPPPSSPLALKTAEEQMDESPSRTVSRPVSRRSPTAVPNALENVPQLAPPLAQPKFGLNASALPGPGFKLYAAREMSGAAEDEDDEEGIDLSKNGFQKIGSFHQAMQATTSSMSR